MSVRPTTSASTTVTSYAEVPVHSLRKERVLVALQDASALGELENGLTRHGYRVFAVRSGRDALALLNSEKIFLAVLDKDLQDISGLQVLEEVQARSMATSVVFASDESDFHATVTALKAGAFDVTPKPLRLTSLLELFERVSEKRLRDLRGQEIVRLRERERLNREHHTEFMLSLVRIIDAKSRYTNQHSMRVGALSRRIAERLSLPDSELDRIELGGKLHDIGKIGIPEAILDKEGPLSAEEYEIIKKHPTIGADLMRPMTLMAPYIPMILYHHENLDGTGYPEGLAGEDIPFDAQIVKLADSFDALTSVRPYRRALSAEQTMAILRPTRGMTINADLVDVLGDLIEECEERGGISILAQSPPPPAEVESSPKVEPVN